MLYTIVTMCWLFANGTMADVVNGHKRIILKQGKHYDAINVNGNKFESGKTTCNINVNNLQLNTPNMEGDLARVLVTFNNTGNRCGELRIKKKLTFNVFEDKDWYSDELGGEKDVTCLTITDEHDTYIKFKFAGFKAHRKKRCKELKACFQILHCILKDDARREELYNNKLFILTKGNADKRVICLDGTDRHYNKLWKSYKYTFCKVDCWHGDWDKISYLDKKHGPLAWIRSYTRKKKGIFFGDEKETMMSTIYKKTNENSKTRIRATRDRKRREPLPCVVDDRIPWFERLTDGDLIDVNYKEKGIWYPATYRGQNERPDYVSVEYADQKGLILGTLKSSIRMRKLPEMPFKVDIGDKIEVNYKEEGKWCPAIYKGCDIDGREGLCAVEYDDTPGKIYGTKIKTVRKVTQRRRLFSAGVEARLMRMFQ